MAIMNYVSCFRDKISSFDAEEGLSIAPDELLLLTSVFYWFLEVVDSKLERMLSAYFCS